MCTGGTQVAVGVAPAVCFESCYVSASHSAASAVQHDTANEEGNEWFQAQVKQSILGTHR
jgi:hypothetical protein